MNDESFILKIDPSQQCGGYDEAGHPCARLAEYAEAELLDNPRQIIITPFCHEHLGICIPPWQTNPAPEAIERERFCITRFVVGHYGGQGTATVLCPCGLDSVPPPYRPETEEDYTDKADQEFFRDHHIADQAYYVSFQDAQGPERHVCAVWRSDYQVWELYEFPQPGLENIS